MTARVQSGYDRAWGLAMKRRKVVFLMLCAMATLAGACRAAGSGAASADEIAWFQKNTQALFDSLPSGDKSLWDRATAASFVMTTEDGEVLDKRRYLESLRPLPPGFSGSIRIVDLTVQDLGGAAVVHYLIDESEDVFGQQLHTKYLETDTYRRDAGAWKMVAAQVTVVPRDLDAVKVDTRGWPALAGDYAISDRSDRRYHVYMRNGVLFGGSDEKSATELIPLSPLVFFQKGSIHTMIFVPDAAGAITQVREVHKYNELIMTRVRR